MSQVTDFTTALNSASKHTQGLIENIIVDNSSDSILLTILNSQVVSVTIAGQSISTPLVDKQVLDLDLSKVTKAQLAGTIAALMLDNIKALKQVKGLLPSEMASLNKSHIAGRFLSEVVPVITGKLTLTTLPNYAVVGASDTTPLSDAEIAKLGINRTSLHNAVWLKYGKTRTKPIAKLVFKFTVDNVNAAKAIDAKLASFPAYDDTGKRIPNSVSQAGDTLNCIVAYVDFEQKSLLDIDFEL
jgi:hypothetical protein